jgi:hypothetical protein
VFAAKNRERFMNNPSQNELLPSGSNHVPRTAFGQTGSILSEAARVGLYFQGGKGPGCQRTLVHSSD